MVYLRLLLVYLERCLGNNNKQLGRVGELMVCFELEKLGYNTSLVDAQGYDIIVNVKDRPLRIQVKCSGTTDKHSAKGGRPRYNFSTSVGKAKRKLTKTDTDIVALAAVKENVIIFKPVEEIKGATLKISEAHFENKKSTKESFERCLSCLG